MKLTIWPRGEREIVFQRGFAAPRQLVFDAYTRPELLRRWFGPRAWQLVVCDIDLRAGGAWRYEMVGPGGEKMLIYGEYREVVTPARLVTTENFEPDWTGGETLVTTELTEADGTTTLTITVLYPSPEARDGAMATGMEAGMVESYARLDELIAEEGSR